MLAHALEKTKPIHIYFVGFSYRDEVWTKIGSSIELITHVLGHPNLERMLHRRFDYYRASGEWFWGNKVFNFAQDLKRGVCNIPTSIEDLKSGLGLFNVSTLRVSLQEFKEYEKNKRRD